MMYLGRLAAQRVTNDLLFFLLDQARIESLKIGTHPLTRLVRYHALVQFYNLSLHLHSLLLLSFLVGCPGNTIHQGSLGHLRSIVTALGNLDSSLVVLASDIYYNARHLFLRNVPDRVLLENRDLLCIRVCVNTCIRVCRILLGLY